MDSVEECTRLLLEAVRNSEEYKTFENYKQQILEQPQLQKKINDFRKKVYQQQNEQNSGDLMEEMKTLFTEREELHKDPLASGFLTSELRLCRMLQHISMEVMNVTDLDLDMLDDTISVQ